MEDCAFATRSIATKVNVRDAGAHDQEPTRTRPTPSTSIEAPKCQLCPDNAKAGFMRLAEHHEFNRVQMGAPYTCPRCSKPYCSLRCYRSEAHVQCTEQFYRECVRSELEGKMYDEREVKSLPEDLKRTVWLRVLFLDSFTCALSVSEQR